MTSKEVVEPTPELVRESYVTEYHKFLQLKAGTKPVTRNYVEIRCRPLSDPDPTGGNFWQKLVGYCLTNNLEPTRLFQAFFSSRHTTSNYMLIKHEQIFQQSILSVYDQLKPSVETCKDRLKSQLSSLASHMDRQEYVNGTDRATSTRCAMAILTSGYCALFRYCILSKIGDDPAAWFIPALRQYAPDFANYDTAWGEYIPEALKVAAAKRRSA